MAISDKTDIYNVAVSLLGDSALQLTGASTVDSTDTKATRAFNLHYDPTLNELVRQHTWNCCINRDQLITSAWSEHGWEYYSALPSGTLRALALTNTDSSYVSLQYKVDWVVEGANILTNYSDPYLTFLKIPSIGAMDPMFLQALYYMVAIKMAIPITGDRKIRAELLTELLGSILPEAKRIDGFEGNNEAAVESTWLNATMSRGVESYYTGFESVPEPDFPWS